VPYDSSYLDKWLKLAEDHLAGNLDLTTFAEKIQTMWEAEEPARVRVVEAISDDYSKSASPEATEETLESLTLWEEGYLCWADYVLSGQVDAEHDGDVPTPIALSWTRGKQSFARPIRR